MPSKKQVGDNKKTATIETRKREKTLKTVNTETQEKEEAQKVKAIDKSKLYDLREAIELLKKTAKTRFVSSVELHLNTTEKGIKVNVALPHGTGKEIKVAVVNDDILKKLEAGVIDFDVLITEPVWMPKLAKFAKMLGPKGLMPNPKNGTITSDVKKAVEQFSHGQIQVKTEAEFPLIHQLVGKADMTTAELAANIKTVVEAVKKPRIKSAFLKTTMSQSIKLDVTKI